MNNKYTEEDILEKYSEVSPHLLDTIINLDKNPVVEEVSIVLNLSPLDKSSFANTLALVVFGLEKEDSVYEFIGFSRDTDTKVPEKIITTLQRLFTDVIDPLVSNVAEEKASQKNIGPTQSTLNSNSVSFVTQTQKNNTYQDTPVEPTLKSLSNDTYKDNQVVPSALVSRSTSTPISETPEVSSHSNTTNTDLEHNALVNAIENPAPSLKTATLAVELPRMKPLFTGVNRSSIPKQNQDGIPAINANLIKDVDLGLSKKTTEDTGSLLNTQQPVQTNISTAPSGRGISKPSEVHIFDPFTQKPGDLVQNSAIIGQNPTTKQPSTPSSKIESALNSKFDQIVASEQNQSYHIVDPYKESLTK